MPIKTNYLKSGLASGLFLLTGYLATKPSFSKYFLGSTKKGVWGSALLSSGGLALAAGVDDEETRKILSIASILFGTMWVQYGSESPKKWSTYGRFAVLNGSSWATIEFLCFQKPSSHTPNSRPSHPSYRATSFSPSSRRNRRPDSRQPTPPSSPPPLAQGSSAQREEGIAVPEWRICPSTQTGRSEEISLHRLPTLRFPNNIECLPRQNERTFGC